MFRTLIGRFRAKRVSSAPSETPTFLQTSTFLQKPAPLQKASVEQIWSSWRYEKQLPTAGVKASRTTSSVVHLERHECADCLGNEQLGRRAKSAE